MNIKVITGSIQEQTAQAIVVNLFEDVVKPGGATGAVDKALGGQIQTLIEAGDFKGKRNEVTVLYPNGAIPAQRVIVVGLGKQDKFTLDIARQAAGTVAKKARDLGVTHIHTVLHGAGIGGLSPEESAEAVVEGALLALYRFHELKTQLDDVRPDVETLTLVEFDPGRADAIKTGARTGQIIAEATMLARDLVNRPANIATPTHIAEVAQQIAEETGLRYQVLDKAELTKLGMGSLLSVNQGGGEPARLIVLEHNAEHDDLPTIVPVSYTHLTLPTKRIV